MQIETRSTTSRQFLAPGFTFANVLIRRCLKKSLRLLMEIATLCMNETFDFIDNSPMGASESLFSEIREKRKVSSR